MTDAHCEYLNLTHPPAPNWVGVSYFGAQESKIS